MNDRELLPHLMTNQAQNLYYFPMIKKDSTSDGRKDIRYRRFDLTSLGRSGHTEKKQIKTGGAKSHPSLGRL